MLPIKNKQWFFFLCIVSQMMLPTYLYRSVTITFDTVQNVKIAVGDTESTNYPHGDIIVVKYNETEMTNERLFKHGHENEALKFCHNFSVLYLVQGHSLFALHNWYTLMYENDNNYMIFLYYNQTKYIADSIKLSALLNITNRHRIKLLIICAFNTSFGVGRNILLSYTFKYEKKMLNGCNFNYICLLDQDIQLHAFNETNNNIIHLNNSFDYNLVLNDFYFNFLDKYNPFVGIPHRIDRGFSSYPQIPTQYLGYKYLKVEAFDRMIVYYSRPLLNNFLFFPLCSLYDSISWFWSGGIQRIKLLMLFPFQKYNISIMYMKTAVTNTQHSEYPKQRNGYQGLVYSQFAHYVDKYLSINTSISPKCNQQKWRKYFFSKRSLWLKQISPQKYNYTKNDAKHYLDEFDLCNLSN